jgi:ribosomal protein S18 acetylase RimI-like enzyme
MALTVRAAERRDLEALGRLGVMLMRTHHAFDPQRFLEAGEHAAAGYAGFLGSILDDPDGKVLVADDGGEIAGYAYAALEPLSWKELRGPAGFIHDVAVDEKARRRGVAARLLEASIEWLRERGAPRVVLWTAAQNVIAHDLFRSLGFRDTMIEMTKEL